MHYQKCFLEVRIKELDILDCMYMHVYDFLAWEKTTGANILPRVSKSEKRKRSLIR